MILIAFWCLNRTLVMLLIKIVLFAAFNIEFLFRFNSISNRGENGSYNWKVVTIIKIVYCKIGEFRGFWLCGGVVWFHLVVWGSIIKNSEVFRKC